MKIDRIDYNRIAQAQSFYKGRGYQNVETPWMVTPQAIRATLPIGKTMMETIRGVLIGSGEQGFIQQMMDGTLEPGLYQTTTPCFQDANEHHSPYYFGSDENNPWSQRIELICYNPKASDLLLAYEKLINDAMACFFEISDADAFDAYQTEDGVDLRHNETILGSCGVRRMGDTHAWIYGTGLIEPRFTLALRSTAGVLEGSHDHVEALETPATGTPDTETCDAATIEVLEGLDTPEQS